MAMTQGDWLVFVIIGAVFFCLGILALLWGRHEEKKIFEALAEQHDLREFTLKHVESPQPGALKLGGWIGLALAVILFAIGVIVRFVA